MKKLFILLVSIFAIFIFNKITSAEQKYKISSENINTVIDGQTFNGINVYKISDQTKYFSIKEIAKIYNANLEWKPVSSQVTMNLNNRKIDIKANSTIVVFGRKKKRMSLPSRFIKGNIYIPPEILTSNEFAQITETTTQWNSSCALLTVTHKSNISSVSFFSKEETSKIIVHLDEPLPYRVERTSQTITLNILRGKIQKDFMEINNGIIEKIQYYPSGKSAVIKINLQQTIKYFKIEKLTKPYRISIDITHSHPIKIIDENIIEQEEDDDEDNLYQLQQSDNMPPDTYQSQIIAINENVDNTDLDTIAVPKFTQSTITDDSFNIVDDTQTMPTIYSPKTTKRKKIIVLDAGHGGKDPGTIGANGTKEKDINLEIVQELKSIFDNDNDYEVILTRKDDTFIPLAERTNIANEHDADLFVSIHCNANLNKNANGFEIYFLSEKATDSEAAATAILENSVLELEGKPNRKRALLQEMLWSMTVNEYMNASAELSAFIADKMPLRVKIPNRGTKQASFYVLKGAQMPAVLIESAFLSNYAEEAKLNTRKFRTAIADSIYEGMSDTMQKKQKKKPINNNPIGIFDSGFGGLTVMSAIHKVLPYENLIYFGDTAHVPYGSKSQNTIVKFSKEIASFLIKQKVKLIVIACNTATAFALPILQRKFKIPIIGVIKPGAKAAILASKNKKIGIIGTEGTINSKSYTKEINKLAKMKVYQQACPLFVPIVEEGLISCDFTNNIVQKYMMFLLNKKIDTLVLGCTHYPLLKEIIKRHLQENITLIDSAQIISQEVKNILEEKKLLASRSKSNLKFYVSDSPLKFKKIGSRFFGKKITNIKKIELDEK
jgi:glutamate racemase